MRSKMFIFLLFSCYFTGSAQDCPCKNAFVDARVDSFFNLKFKIIGREIKYKHQFSQDDYRFLYLISSLSGISIEVQGYVGTVKKITKNDLKKWKIWYQCKKCKISWQDHIVKGIEAIEKIPAARNLEEIEKYARHLDEIYIN